MYLLMAIDCFTVSPFEVASSSYLVDTRIEQTMRRFISKRLIAVPDLVDTVAGLKPLRTLDLMLD